MTDWSKVVLVAGTGHRKSKHGFSLAGNRHPMYHIYTNMKQRCCNKRASNYDRYGGLGITIQDSWMNDPVAFIVYVESLPRYELRQSLHLTLDRIDSKGNYCEGNLRWSTAKEQANNRAWPGTHRFGDSCK